MKLVVLDFAKDITYVYTIKESDVHAIDIADPQHEDWLEYFGHREKDCQWMLTKNEIIIK